jgi:hypothetical protein
MHIHFQLPIKHLAFIGLLLTIIGCTSTPKKNETSTVQEKISSVRAEASHVIDLKCQGEYLPLRKEILTEKVLIDAQKGDENAKRINDKSILRNIYNGQEIRVINNYKSRFYFIEIIDHGQVIDKGYIVSKLCGEPTIRKLEKVSIPKYKSNSTSKDTYSFIAENYLPNSSLLSNVFAYLSPEADFIQVLSLEKIDDRKIRYKIFVVELQQRTLMFDGAAELVGYYTDSNGVSIGRYNADNVLGKRMEIHINKTGTHCFLSFDENFNQQDEIAPRAGNEAIIEGSSEFVLMNRIK